MDNERTIELLQYVNTLIASMCSVFIHGFIIYRIRTKYSVLTQYQNLLIIQSTIYLVGTVLRLLVNRTATLNGEERRGHSFMQMSPQVDFVLLYSLNTVEPGESLILTVFSVHRVLLFTRPASVSCFYFIAIPLASSYALFYAYMVAFHRESIQLLLLGFFSIISSIITVCYMTLKRYFKRSSYSLRVRRMQNKLSNGIVIQIIIHITSLCLVSLRKVFLEGYILIFGDNENAVRYLSALYIVVVYMVFIWYPVVTGLLIRWSISGFLKPRTPLGLKVLAADLSRIKTDADRMGSASSAHRDPPLVTPLPSATIYSPPP